VLVQVGGAPLEPGRGYRLATKAYLTEGKDGYDCLKVGGWGGEGWGSSCMLRCRRGQAAAVVYQRGVAVH
jgi:hypothetical protein